METDISKYHKRDDSAKRNSSAERRHDPLKEVDLLIKRVFYNEISYIWLYPSQKEKNHQEKEDQKCYLQIKIYRTSYKVYRPK